MQSSLVLRFFRRRFPILILALAPFVHAPSAHAKCLQLGLVYQGALAPDKAQLINRCINRVGYVYCILNGSNPPRPFYCADAKFGAGFVPAGGSDVISVVGSSGPAKVRWYECEAQEPDDYPIPVNPRFDMIEVNADCPQHKKSSDNPFAQGSTTKSSDNPFTPDKSKVSSDNPFAPGSSKTAQSQTTGKGGKVNGAAAPSGGGNSAAPSSMGSKAAMPPSSSYSGNFTLAIFCAGCGGRNFAFWPCEVTFSISIDNRTGAVSGTAEITNGTPMDANDVLDGHCPFPRMGGWERTDLSGSVSTVPDGRGGFTQTINGSLQGNGPGFNACPWGGTFTFSPPSPPRGSGNVFCRGIEGVSGSSSNSSWSTN